MIYYLIGIKGSGMSALAKVLYDKGHIVYGIDYDEYFFTEKSLYNMKIENFNDYELKNNYVYIIGNAFKNHKLTKYIIDNKYKYFYYASFINNYFKNYSFIAVSGSHGKTTTTTILSVLLNDCSYIIGDGSGSGKSNNNFVVEACEYKDTFLNYYPDISLILNIDYDHPDYFKNVNDYVNSFRQFSLQTNYVIANGDDKNVKKIKSSRFLTYGINKDNDIVFDYEVISNKMKIKILRQEFMIPFVGKHYAYDFVGAYLVSKMKGITDKEIEERINRFKFPKRRMEIKRINNSILICDYAHHPTEIKCLYESIVNMYLNKKIVCFFQPHTISRSKALLNEFKESLSLFDETYILKTFTSVREVYDIKTEEYIYNFWGFKVVSKEELLSYDYKEYIYLFVGAGNIDEIYNKI